MAADLLEPVPALLEVANLSKTFPGLKALDRVNFTVRSGEVVALVGQNGSGKSTLVKVLAGIHTPDPGAEIRLLRPPHGADAQLHFIHQDLGLVANLSTVENLTLGRTFGYRRFLPNPVKAEVANAVELVGRYGGNFDVTQPVGNLTPGERTTVAIARALNGWEHPANVLVLDEPTASLHGDEVQVLFHAVRRVAQQGAGVVFISHRLDEVIDLADRVIALRDGQLVADVRRGQFDHDDLVALVAGAVQQVAGVRPVRQNGQVVLRAADVRGTRIRSVDIELRAGEILGVSGVLGSGREELSGILFGARPGEVRHLEVAGKVIEGLTPARAIAAGIAFVSGDRHRDGAIMTMNARENMTLPRLSPLRRAFGRLDGRAERAEVGGWIDRVGLTPPNGEQSIQLFSGGNQQKVMLAKWLRNNPIVLLLDEPTQGVDVGAKTAIFELIAAAAEHGAGVVICSADAKELALICDRVMVLPDGKAVALLDHHELSEATVVSAELGPSRSKRTRTVELLGGAEGDA